MAINVPVALLMLLSMVEIASVLQAGTGTGIAILVNQSVEELKLGTT